MELHSFKPLQKKSEIRVLQLLPGLHGDPLAGHLRVLDLDTHPYYTCLSYTWGELVFNGSIDIDGKQLRTTPNLDAALRRLRRTELIDGYIEIWIDAVCIDQANIAERSHQVSMMRRIYSQCNGCIIYMGEEYDNSELVPGFQDQLCMAYTQLWQDEGFRFGDSVMELRHDSYSSIPAEDDPGWPALRRFMTRPWFRRVWVIQEFALPKEITMMCGEWQMPGTMLGTLLFLAERIPITRLKFHLETPALNQLATEGMNRAAEHMETRCRCGHFPGPEPEEIIIGPERRPLLHLLNLARNCDSHDPRDRVYGVLGLATDVDASDVVVDYSKGPLEIALDVARHLIKKGDAYKMLQLVGSLDGPRRDWPSWLPEWTKAEAYSFNPGKRHRSDLSNPHLQPNLPALRLQFAQATLIVKGFILDIVEELAPRRERVPEGENSAIPGESFASSMANLVAEFQHLEAMVADSRFLRADQKRPDSLWRTMIANSSLFGATPAPPEYGAKYKHYKKMTLGVARHAHDEARNAEGEAQYDFDEIERFREEAEAEEAAEEEEEKEDDEEGGESIWDKLEKANWARYQDYEEFKGAWTSTQDARLCITQSGMIALAPKFAQVGDVVFTVLGDPHYETYVIRREEEEAQGEFYTWIGQAYVHCVVGDEYCEIEGGLPCEIVVR